MPLVRRALRAFARKGALTRASRAQRSLDLLDTDDHEASVSERSTALPPEPSAAEPVAYAHVGSTPAAAVGAPEAPEVGHAIGGDGSAGAATGPAPSPEAVAPPPPPDPGEPEVFGDRIEQEFAALHPGPEPAGTNGDRGESPGAGNAEAERETEGEPDASEGKGRKGLRFW